MDKENGNGFSDSVEKAKRVSFSFLGLRILESWNVLDWKGPLKNHIVPNSFHGQGNLPLDLISQSPIPLGIEQLNRLCHF